MEINFLRLIHPEIILKEFNLTTCKETKTQSLKREGRRLFTHVKADSPKTFSGDNYSLEIDELRDVSQGDDTHGRVCHTKKK